MYKARSWRSPSRWAEGGASRSPQPHRATPQKNRAGRTPPAPCLLHFEGIDYEFIGSHSQGLYADAIWPDVAKEPFSENAQPKSIYRNES